MNEPIKILFDENFGKPLVTALARFLDLYEERVEITHLFTFAKASEKDEVWIPKIAPGGWLVISTDKGKRCGGKKLPAICREHKVSHVLLSTGLHRSKQFEKVRAVVAVWPRIVQAARWTKGTRYSLRYEGADKRIALVECFDKESTHAGGSPPLLGFDGQRRKAHRVTKRKKISEIPENESLFKNLHGENVARQNGTDTNKPANGV